MLNKATQQITIEIKIIKQSSKNKFLTELTAESTTEYPLWKTLKHFKYFLLEFSMEVGLVIIWKKQIYLQSILKQDFFNTNDYLDKIALVTPRKLLMKLKTYYEKAPGFDL